MAQMVIAYKKLQEVQGYVSDIVTLSDKKAKLLYTLANCKPYARVTLYLLNCVYFTRSNII